MKTKTNSPYHEVGEALINKGLVILPLRENHKAPTPAKWTDYTKEQSKNTLADKGNYNIGLLLGKTNGVLALDFDHGSKELNSRILKICGQSDLVKKGAKGGTIFFRYNGEKSKKWKKDGEMVLELLSDGTQTVIPPSIHPDTMSPYIYTKGKTLLDIDVSELPFLPTDFSQKMDELMSGKKVLSSSSDLDIAGEALYFVQPEDYDTWLKCGMALKNSFGDDGFEVWDKWSSKDPKYNANEMFPKWKSFKGDGITTASIFKIAIKNGYTPPKNVSSFFNVGNAKLEFDRWRLRGRPIGISSGIEPFDNHLHIRPKEYTVVTGMPNSGKSEFLDFLVYNIAKNHKQKVMFCSLEKDPSTHIESFVHRYVGKSLEERTTLEEQGALNEIQSNLFFYNHLYESKDIDAILTKAKEVSDSVGLDVLVIDPFSYLTSCKIGSEFEHVRYVNIQIANFAKKNSVHVFLVAHPKTLENRKAKEKYTALTLYSISGGANFYNSCDNGMVISRDGNDVEVDIQKIREQAVDSTGSFMMQYDKPTRSYKKLDGGF
jgi:KaiC/GvpD/RAD55 family RecA-like ATPase